MGASFFIGFYSAIHFIQNKIVGCSNANNKELILLKKSYTFRYI